MSCAPDVLLAALAGRAPPQHHGSSECRPADGSETCGSLPRAAPLPCALVGKPGRAFCSRLACDILNHTGFKAGAFTGPAFRTTGSFNAGPQKSIFDGILMRQSPTDERTLRGTCDVLSQVCLKDLYCHPCEHGMPLFFPNCFLLLLGLQSPLLSNALSIHF